MWTWGPKIGTYVAIVYRQQNKWHFQDFQGEIRTFSGQIDPLILIRTKSWIQDLIASPVFWVWCNAAMTQKLSKQCHFWMMPTLRWYERFAINWSRNMKLSSRKKERNEKQRRRGSVIKAGPVFTLSPVRLVLTHLIWLTHPLWLRNGMITKLCFITRPPAEDYFLSVEEPVFKI